MPHSKVSTFYECLYAVSCVIFACGLFVGGWAHVHVDASVETFFAPWNVVLYTGYLATAGTLYFWTAGRRAAMGSHIDAVPPGHGLSLVGVLLFVVGIAGDMLWPATGAIDTLLSPSHLLLSVAIVLMLSGGMRYFWATRTADHAHGFFAMLPLVLSAALTVTVILFMVQYGGFTEIQAMNTLPRDPIAMQSVSLLSVLVFTGSIMGALALLLRRERLPFGSVTLMVFLPTLVFATMRSGLEAIPAAFLAGVLSDMFLHMIGSRFARMLSLRLFFFLLPALHYTFYLLFLSLRHEQLWWSAHAVAGMPFLAGCAGVLISCIAWPPYHALGAEYTRHR